MADPAYAGPAMGHMIQYARALPGARRISLHYMPAVLVARRLSSFSGELVYERLDRVRIEVILVDCSCLIVLLLNIRFQGAGGFILQRRKRFIGNQVDLLPRNMRQHSGHFHQARHRLVGHLRCFFISMRSASAVDGHDRHQHQSHNPIRGDPLFLSLNFLLQET